MQAARYVYAVTGISPIEENALKRRKHSMFRKALRSMTPDDAGERIQDETVAAGLCGGCFLLALVGLVTVIRRRQYSPT